MGLDFLILIATNISRGGAQKRPTLQFWIFEKEAVHLGVAKRVIRTHVPGCSVTIPLSAKLHYCKAQTIIFMWIANTILASTMPQKLTFDRRFRNKYGDVTRLKKCRRSPI